MQHGPDWRLSEAVDPNRLEELRKRVGPGFRDHDFEAVLGTDVVNGIPGSARILAVAVW